LSSRDPMSGDGESAANSPVEKLRISRSACGHSVHLLLSRTGRSLTRQAS